MIKGAGSSALITYNVYHDHENLVELDDGSLITGCIKQEQIIEEEREDQIQSFDDFINELNFKLPQINSFLFHKQIDGICFYKLMRDARYSDLKFHSKILIDKDMNFKVFINDYLIPDQTIGFKKLEFWYQIQYILENFEAFEEIQMTEKDHFSKAIEHLNSIYGLCRSGQFRKQVFQAKDFLEKLMMKLENENFEDCTILGQEVGEINFEQQVEGVHPTSNPQQTQNLQESQEPENPEEEEEVEEQMEFNFITECCGKVLEEQELESHNCQVEVQEERKQELLVCDLCGQEFNSFKHVRRHILEVHKSAQKETNVQNPATNLLESCDCGVQFYSSASLSSHQRSCPTKQLILNAIKPKPPPKDKYPCPIDGCLAVASSKVTLQKHLKSIHTVQIENLDRFCLECKQSFESPNLFIIHKREHFKFSCQVCSKKCKTESALITVSLKFYTFLKILFQRNLISAQKNPQNR